MDCFLQYGIKNKKFNLYFKLFNEDITEYFFKKIAANYLYFFRQKTKKID
jgi:hypothetical protein